MEKVACAIRKPPSGGFFCDGLTANNQAHHLAGEIAASGADGIAQNGEQHADRSERRVESSRNHRRRSRAADICLGADGEEEARCADDFRDDEDEGDVEEHPDHADHDDAEVVENLVQLHLHADRADEDIDENGAEA